MIKNTAKILHMDADGFAKNTDRALIILSIAREQIEAQNISSVLERLQILSDSPENTRLRREALVISVDGYSNDSRELFEIKEVRVFFKKLNKEWPHWLWFLNREAGSVKLILALLCEIKISLLAGVTGTEFTNNNELASFVGDMFSRGNYLFDAHGITNAEATESAKSAMAEIF